MIDADETRRRWEEIRWIDAVCERWEALFGSLRDEPCRAEAICSFGMKLIMEVRANALPQSGTGGWVPLFSLLADCPEAARSLCLLGLAMVRREVERNEATRSRVRAILWACRPQVRLVNDHDSLDRALNAHQRGDPNNGGNKSGDGTREADNARSRSSAA